MIWKGGFYETGGILFRTLYLTIEEASKYFRIGENKLHLQQQKIKMQVADEWQSYSDKQQFEKIIDTLDAIWRRQKGLNI